MTTLRSPVSCHHHKVWSSRESRANVERQDLDSVMEVFHSAKDVEKAREVCPVCRSEELVEGTVRSTGLNYFVPSKTKFWTLKGSDVETKAKMCANCGAIVWFGDTAKLSGLLAKAKEKQTGTGDQRTDVE